MRRWTPAGPIRSLCVQSRKEDATNYIPRGRTRPHDQPKASLSHYPLSATDIPLLSPQVATRSHTVKLVIHSQWAMHVKV